MSIRIDELPATTMPSLDHVFPAMKDGVTVRYSGQQLADLIVAALTDSAPTTLDTLNELAAALGDDPNFAATVTASLAAKADDAATSAALNLKAPLASPALTGTPIAPTADPATNTTQIATTAYVQGEFNARSWTARGVVTDQATVDITGIPSNFTKLEIQLRNIIPASDAADLYARIDSGSGFISTAGTYSWFQRFASTAVASTDTSAVSDSKMIVANGFGNGANETGNLSFHVVQASTNNIPGFSWVGELRDAVAAYRRAEGNGRRLAVGRVEGVQFLMSAGNISCEYQVIATLE